VKQPNENKWGFLGEGWFKERGMAFLKRGKPNWNYLKGEIFFEERGGGWKILEAANESEGNGYCSPCCQNFPVLSLK
jgi:hypothetical protein